MNRMEGLKAIMVIVVAFVPDEGSPLDRYVVLIEKKRPHWQAGRLNVPGGHIEDNEMPWAAAIREFKEEVGIDLNKHEFEFVGDIMKQGKFGLYIFGARIDMIPEEIVKAAEGLTDERIIVQDVAQALNDPRLISNLTYQIPEAMKIMDNWRPGGENAKLMTGKESR